MWGESLIKGTDLELSFEDHLDYLKEIIPYSKNDRELITEYINQYNEAVTEGKIRCHCSLDNTKFVVALAVAYEGKINAEKAKKSDYMMGNLIKITEKKISDNSETKKIAEKVYSLLKPKLEDYKYRYKIDDKQIEEALNYTKV